MQQCTTPHPDTGGSLVATRPPGILHTFVCILSDPGNHLATLAYRGLTSFFSVLALLGQATYLDALYWRPLGFGSMSHGSLRPALLSAVITGAVVSVAAAARRDLSVRGDNRRGARPLGLALAAWAYLLAYSGMVVLLSPRNGGILRTLFEGHFLIVESIGLAALLRFTAVFPGPLEASDLRAPETVPVGLRTLQRVRIWLLRPGAPWVAAFLAAAVSMVVNAAMGRRLQDTPLLSLVDVFRLGALTLVVLNLRHAFLLADLAMRTRMRSIVVGFTLLIGGVGLVLGGNVLAAVTNWELPRVNWRPSCSTWGCWGCFGAERWRSSTKVRFIPRPWRRHT